MNKQLLESLNNTIVWYNNTHKNPDLIRAYFLNNDFKNGHELYCPFYNKITFYNTKKNKLIFLLD